MLAIGEVVWVAVAKKHEAVEQACPDCRGQKYLTVILGDASQVTIDCSTCSSGYGSPLGCVLVSTYKPAVLVSSVQEIAKGDADNVVYSGEGFYRVTESELSDSSVSAFTLAVKKSEDADTEEKARLQRKEKDSRTWAWNVTYHRRCIKQAEKDLAYHKSKLDVSLQHKKAGDT